MKKRWPRKSVNALKGATYISTGTRSLYIPHSLSGVNALKGATFISTANKVLGGINIVSMP